MTSAAVSIAALLVGSLSNTLRPGVALALGLYSCFIVAYVVVVWRGRTKETSAMLFLFLFDAFEINTMGAIDYWWVRTARRLGVLFLTRHCAGGRGAVPVRGVPTKVI